jgi:hypothetical protein
MAKAGLAFALNKSAKTYKGEEIEYPMDEKEIASLDDLFRETPSSRGSKKSTSEDDALSLLFQPEQGAESSDSESLSPSENSEVSEFPDTDVGRLMSRVQELKNEMNQKSQLIDDLQQQVRRILIQAALCIGAR